MLNNAAVLDLTSKNEIEQRLFTIAGHFYFYFLNGLPI